MIHKLLPILIGLLICLCPLHAFAAEVGSIEINLPKEMAGEIVNCAKEGEEKQTITVNENGIAKIENLGEGNYQIEIPETADYTFMPVEVHIPSWSEEEERMLYEITVIPKYSVKEKPISVKETTPPVEKITSPLTSDNGNHGAYIRAGIISLIILVIMSCHNRFNCDTMTGKYSKNGGYNNGNDNDTENPRCARRIGLSGPWTID